PDPLGTCKVGRTFIEYDVTDKQGEVDGGQYRWQRSRTLAACIANRMCSEFSVPNGIRCDPGEFVGSTFVPGICIDSNPQCTGSSGLAVLHANVADAVLGEACGRGDDVAAGLCSLFSGVSPGVTSEATGYYDGLVDCYTGGGPLPVGDSFHAEALTCQIH